ncbi:MAG: hypothetical protein ABJK28_09685 [Algibacter sp.]
MNSLKYINSIHKNERSFFFIKKISESGFWDNTIFGLIQFILNRDKDYFSITNKRIVYLVKNKLIKNSEYSDFSKIKFNSNNDQISFKNLHNQTKAISLRKLRMTYEEIQKLKKTLNQNK